jgi:hypothetical protein
VADLAREFVGNLPGVTYASFQGAVSGQQDLMLAPPVGLQDRVPTASPDRSPANSVEPPEYQDQPPGEVVTDGTHEEPEAPVPPEEEGSSVSEEQPEGLS